MPAACWPDTNLEHSGPNAFGSSIACGFPTGWAAGHLLLQFHCMSTDQASIPSPGIPDGWTELFNFQRDGSGRRRRYCLYGRLLDGTEGGSVTYSNGMSRTEWLSPNVWLDAKMEGDESGPSANWFDDSGSATGTSIELESSRPDNIFLLFSGGDDNTNLNMPAGFCRFHFLERSGGWANAHLGAIRNDSIGTQSYSFTGGSPGSIAALIPMNPYAGPAVAGWGVGVTRRSRI